MINQVPNHIAIVMDGNGRWAEQKGMQRIEGHKAGLDSVKVVIQSCLEHHIPYLSLFAFSSENWARPIEEVDFLMQLFLEALRTEIAELHDNGIRLQFTGNRKGLSETLCEQMSKAEALTAKNKKMSVNIVVNYGGKWDITQAAQQLARAVQEGELTLDQVTEACFSQYLAMAHLPDPDLLIRTSGELRISNFFLWQMAYTELYFTEIMWPDFREQAFNDALQDYVKRQRRYGRLVDDSSVQDKGASYA